MMNGIESRNDGNNIKPKYCRKGKRGAKNQNRHRLFLRWMLQTFPNQIESSTRQLHRQETQPHQALIPLTTPHQNFILDIAGGKGELTTRLCVCHSVCSVLIDPRSSDLSHCFDNIIFKTLPRKWKDSISSRLLSNQDFILEKLQLSTHQLVMNFDAYRVETCPELQWAVQNASLLVGLHADAATEDIVDVALRYRKPFVVVPCCVYPNFFKTRWLGTDTATLMPVRCYDEFCDYLLQKDSHFQKEILPFEGRNVAIWWNGISCDKDIE